MLKNLRLAFGTEKTEAELLRIAEQSIQNLFKLVFEFLHTPEASANPERYIGPPDVTPLLEAVKKKGGFIAIVSHFGNWEWLAIPIKKYGLHVHAVGRPVKNPYLYQYIMEMREAANLTNIEKSGAVRSSLEVLKQRGIHCKIVWLNVAEHGRKSAADDRVRGGDKRKRRGNDFARCKIECLNRALKREMPVGEQAKIGRVEFFAQRELQRFMLASAIGEKARGEDLAHKRFIFFHRRQRRARDQNRRVFL